MIDCPNRRALAEFDCQTLGMKVNEDIDDGVVIGAEAGLRQLGFQKVDERIPPRWPDRPIRSNCTSAFASAMPTKPSKTCSLSAPRACTGNVRRAFESSPTPVGHPFCIVFGRHSTA